MTNPVTCNTDRDKVRTAGDTWSETIQIHHTAITHPSSGTSRINPQATAYQIL